MADITMCEGVGCPMKQHCYRYTANACEYRQSYFAVVPVRYDPQGEGVDAYECSEFVENK